MKIGIISDSHGAFGDFKRLMIFRRCRLYIALRGRALSWTKK